MSVQMDITIPLGNRGAQSVQSVLTVSVSEDAGKWLKGVFPSCTPMAYPQDIP